MSDSTDTKELSVEELEQQIAANKAIDKLEHDARKLRGEETAKLFRMLVRQTARCWVVVFDEGDPDGIIQPASPKGKTHYRDLTFTAEPEQSVESLEHVQVHRKTRNEVKISIQTDDSTGAFIRLPVGQSITIGVDYVSNNKIKLTRTYTVHAFATEDEAIELQHEIVLINDPCPTPL